MTWFKVDDGSAFNAKVLAAGNEAWGAFCRVGAWCAQQLSDGRFSRAIATTIAPMRVWEKLIEVGLVDRISNGEMEMHDFLQRNPSKAQVLAERRAAKDRMTRARSADVRPNSERTNGGSSPSPSRPVPSQPERESDARAEDRASERRLKSVPPPAIRDPETRISPKPPEAVEPEGPPASRSDIVTAESGYDLARRVWSELWAAKYRRPYDFSPRMGPGSEDYVLQRVGESATIRVGGAEAYLRHKFGAYLRDHGTRGYLDEECHPLRCLERDWAKYGEPKEPRRMVPRREEPPVELVSVEEMAARAAAAMTLKVGTGGT